VQVVKAGKARVEIPLLLEKLFSLGIRSVMVEGGPKVLTSFFERRLFDLAFVFVSPVLIGGDGAPGPFRGSGFETVEKSMRLRFVRARMLGDDVLLEAVPK
jgi:riboflavin biosynthesis pyrimidine reductase